MQRQYFLVESADRETIAPDAIIHLDFGGKTFGDAAAAYHHGRTLVTSREVKSPYLLVCFQDGMPNEELIASRSRKELIVPVT